MRRGSYFRSPAKAELENAEIIRSGKTDQRIPVTEDELHACVDNESCAHGRRCSQPQKGWRARAERRTPE
jgi:hypothetical protein